MSSSSVSTAREYPRPRASGTTNMRLSSPTPSPSPSSEASRIAPHATGSPSTRRRTIARMLSPVIVWPMSSSPYRSRSSSCWAVRRRAASGSSQSTRASVVLKSADQRLQHGREEAQAVGARAGPLGAVGAEALLDRVLGVRHEADHVARGVRDAGDAAAGAVGVPALVAEDHAALALELVERVLVGDVLPVLVLQRDRDVLSRRVVAGPGRVDVVDREDLLAAHAVQVVVLDHRAGQQVGLGEHLEAVADAQDRQALVRGVDDLAHHRRETADGARAQIVAV